METRYKCTECGAEDSDHQDYAPAPIALICWRCRAGWFKVGDRIGSPYEQAQRQIGMLRKVRKEGE